MSIKYAAGTVLGDSLGLIGRDFLSTVLSHSSPGSSSRSRAFAR
jgi:hypothetical protein